MAAMVTGAPAVLVLAAGGSRRLGRAKQFLRLRGRTLLHAAVVAARCGGGRRPCVVTGARRFAVALAARRAGGTTLHNAQWQHGMGASLAAGIARCERAPAVLVVAVDQPDIDRRDLRRLIAAWRRRPHHPAAARYTDRLGIPAVLPRRLYPALRRLTGDSGARRLLNADRRRVTAVSMARAARDIDTPADWQARRRRSRA